MSLNRGAVFAKSLLEELGTASDVFAIARKLGLDICWVNSSGFDGALVRPINLPIGTILVRDSIKESGRKAFTIAHEIGHFVIPGHDQRESVCLAHDIDSWSSEPKTREREADEFAAELLMPTSLVRPLVKSNHPSLGAVECVAQVGGASLAAAGRRYCEFSSERCAFIWSAPGGIAWSARSSEFGYRLNKGTEIQPGTFAFDCFKQQVRMQKPEQVDASLWLPTSNVISGAKLREHSRYLPWYDSVVTLLWIDKAIEKFTNEDTLLEELDPNEFGLGRKRWPGRK